MKNDPSVNAKLNMLCTPRTSDDQDIWEVIALTLVLVGVPVGAPHTSS